MKVRDVILQALAGKLTWIQAPHASPKSLVATHHPRGRHRRRREPRPCFGELLHLDGRRHQRCSSGATSMAAILSRD